MSVIRDILIGILIVVLQITVFRHLRILGVEPDITIILLFMWMVRYDRTRMLLIAFSIGFFQDMLLDWWGLNMFAKTLTVMLLHPYVPKKNDSTLGIYPFTLYLTLTVFLHQIFLLLMTLFSDSFALGGSNTLFLIGNTLFTSGLGMVAYILSGKRF